MSVILTAPHLSRLATSLEIDTKLETKDDKYLYVTGIAKFSPYHPVIIGVMKWKTFSEIHILLCIDWMINPRVVGEAWCERPSNPVGSVEPCSV